MGLYTRKDFERDSALIEELRTSATRALLRKAIDGFEKRRTDIQCDRGLDKLLGKLAATRMILADREAMKKSPRFVFIIPRKTKPFLWRRATTQFTPIEPAYLSGGCWQDEDGWHAGHELQQWLAEHRCTAIWVVSRGAKSNGKEPLEGEEPENVINFNWLPCSIEQAKAYSQAGDWEPSKDGKTKEFRAHYMVRYSGTIEQPYGEYIDIRVNAIEDSRCCVIEGEGETSPSPPKAMAASVGS
jgi:hypothetical protein